MTKGCQSFRQGRNTINIICEPFLDQIFCKESQLELKARAYHRVLKFSQTIADMPGSEVITQVHLAQALQFWPRLVLM